MVEAEQVLWHILEQVSSNNSEGAGHTFQSSLSFIIYKRPLLGYYIRAEEKAFNTMVIHTTVKVNKVKSYLVKLN